MASSTICWNAEPKKVTVLYAKEVHRRKRFFLSTTGHVKSCRNPARLCAKTKHAFGSIVNQYREGKLKSTPRGE